uniref:NADH:ubiquinone reductase (H(+)-translocating) n=1 Tax=Gastraspis sp. ZJUH_2016016 TaxID=2491177 RepID=A0A3S8V0T6_9HYME|nr:NADH dehydrogenase subunit 5 [Gastraspis sp. ZJUH_2016016]
MIFNIYMYSLMSLSIFMFLMSLLFIMIKKMILIKWFFYSLMSWNFEFLMFIDWMTLMFMSIVMFISSLVMLYSKEYMISELKKKYFIMILMMFVISMIFMIISPNIFSIIIGWDGLGLISYCLIIYYQNLYSLNSGMLTLMSNRIGDIMLLLMIFMIMNINSWNLMLYQINNFLFLTLFLLMMMTKSAQIPFSMWLPAAMAAPTPVSSLVHSSTLVTAGIYLLIRFNKMFITNKMNYFIMIIGLLTMIYSSMNALMEFDLKKIIAFSTLSQLGLMMMMLSLSLNNFVFFHLISHAMFKSLLFLCSGMMIHSLFDSQDIRFMGNLIHEIPLTISYFNIANLSLCGFPFLSGFFSKDLLYEMIINWNINLMIFLLMYLCIALTIMYSFRLMFYLTFNLNMLNSPNLKMDNFIMNMSTMLLFLMSIIFGTLINWILFSAINLSIITINLKLLIYIPMIMSMMIFIFLKISTIMLKINFFNLIMMLSYFMFLLKITLMNNFTFLHMSKNIIFINELYWNEYYSKFMTNFFFNKLYNFFSSSLFNMISLMIMMFLLIFITMNFMI